MSASTIHKLYTLQIGHQALYICSDLMHQCGPTSMHQTSTDTRGLVFSLQCDTSCCRRKKAFFVFALHQIELATEPTETASAHWQISRAHTADLQRPLLPQTVWSKILCHCAQNHCRDFVLPESVDVLTECVPTLPGKTSTQDGSRVNNFVFMP